MTTESIIGIVLSSVTSTVAIIALFISVVQIRKSNKQSLFEKRLNAFLNIKSMKSLCDQHKDIIAHYLDEIKDGPVFTVDLLFVWMTNNAFLETIQPSIHHVLETEWQRKYLLKVEELKSLREEAKLIFPKKYNNKISDFVSSYQELLISLYKYQVAYKDISKECHELKKPFPKNNQLEIRCRKSIENNLSLLIALSEEMSEKEILKKLSRDIRL